MNTPFLRMLATRGITMGLALALATASAPFLLRAQVQAPAPAPVSKINRLQQRLQAKFDELHAAAAFPGGTAGFALPDGTSFGIATGVSDTATKAAMKPSDRMLMGSVGKTYVAAVALQLIGEGRFALDDKIEKHLGKEPWFARLPNARDVTVRHLMTHTSGLVRYEFKEQFTADLTRQPDKIWRPEGLLAYVLDSPPPFAPGTDWEYSDTNYIVLGMIIERTTGSTYYAQMKKRLLDPLKLRDTAPSDSQRIPGLVQGYAGPNNPFGGTDAMIQNGRFVINPQFEWTGGGVAGTTQDLARWARALYGGGVVPASLMPEMVNGVAAKLGPNTKYGLGVIIRPTAFGTSYGHSGFFPGYLTEMMYFPDMKVAIAVQVNSSAPRVTGKPLVRFLTDFAGIISEELKTGR